MKITTYTLTFGCLLLLSGCFANSPKNQALRIDETPMYGGIDRSIVTELRDGDMKFISAVTKKFGSREKASSLWVNQGYRFYNQGQTGMAMRRFNQAWLLNPSNSEVYTGFGALLLGQGKNCEAMEMMETALTLNPPTFQGIYPDTARTITLCSISNNSLSPEAKEKLTVRSDALYKKAEQIEPDKRYIFSSWATAYYWRGQYSDAWRMVAKARALGTGSGAIAGMPSGAANEPNEKFLNMLRKKMPEPVPQRTRIE
jgi:tetratricopeptide (TPR) repeat protein